MLREYRVRYYIPEDYKAEDEDTLKVFRKRTEYPFIHEAAAIREMVRLLKKGIPAWIEIEDWSDDIPF